MDTYEVSLVAEGLDPSVDDLGALFAVLPDALPARIGGLATISAPVEAEGPGEAVDALAEMIIGALPKVRIVRVDQDLVSIPDIAERTGRTRESVRLLVEGKRGPGSFPAPIGIVGDGIRVWPWEPVAAWFAEVFAAELGERGIPPEVAAAADARFAAEAGLAAAV